MVEPQRRVAGYADLAKFIASDKVFCIFRRFESLSARNLLYMQDEICELEERLRVLDKGDLQSNDPSALYSLHSRRDDKNVERREIMRQIRVKLWRYRKYVLSNFSWILMRLSLTDEKEKSLCMHSQCTRMEKARDMYVDSVRNWMDGKKPVVEEESHFLDDQNDLASLSLKGEEYHLFEKWVEMHFSHIFETKVGLSSAGKEIRALTLMAHTETSRETTLRGGRKLLFSNQHSSSHSVFAHGLRRCSPRWSSFRPLLCAEASLAFGPYCCVFACVRSCDLSCNQEQKFRDICRDSSVRTPSFG